MVGKPALYIFMTESINPKYPHGVEVVVGIVIENPKGEILLVKSPKWGDKWTIPGGHVDPGENIFKTAIREAKEETGLNCQAVAIFTAGENINSPEFHRPAHFVGFGVYCQSDGNNLKLDGDELKEYLWITPENVNKVNFMCGFGDSISEFIEFKKTAKISQNYIKS